MQTVRGTKDLIGEDVLKYNYVVETARNFAKLHNYQEIITPIFEFSDVFERNLGDTSDVVMKEIYKFKDKSDNYLSLRPEFTAGIVRAIITNPELHNNFPLKLFSHGPVFRYDRPQMGRQRQFNQINFEYFGNPTFYAEIDTLRLANGILRKFGFSNLKLEINSLGCDESRAKYEIALKEYFSKYLDELSEFSKIRLEKNVLRILDSKEDCDKKLLVGIPEIKNFYTAEDKEFFANVLNKLELIGIKYNVNGNLVRGLDYYNHTVFEFTTTDLGAQSTVLAGGRYNNLMKKMGGRDTPAIGFAAGIERIMLLLKEELKQNRAIGLIPIGEKEIDYCLSLQTILKENGLNVELFASANKVKLKFDLANKFNCKYVIVVGENEVLDGTTVVKNLDSGEEEKVSCGKLLDYLRTRV